MKKVIVDKDLLYHYYIEENHNIQDTATLMNISYRTIQRAIKEFGFNKDGNQIQEQRKDLLKEKYGVENTYQLESSIEKSKQTKLERYGNENYNNSKQQKRTMIDKYGVSCGYNLPEVQEKIKLEYGGIGYASKIIQDRIKITNQEKYGVDYPLQNQDISNKVKNKMKKTLQEKYGVTHNWNIPEVRERTKQTNLDKYGVPYFCMREECYSKNGFTISKINQRFANLLKENNIEYEFEYHIKGDIMKKIEVNISKEELYDLYINQNLRRIDIANKLNISEGILKRLLKEYNIKKDISARYKLSQETKLKKYGNTCNMQIKEVIDKRNKTMLDRYGSISAFNDKSIYNKRNKTMLDKYGVKYIMQTKEGKSKLNWNSEKQKQTMLKKYGVDNGFKLIDKIKETKLKKYGNENYNNHNKQRQTMIDIYGDAIHQKKAKQTNLEKYGVEYSCLTKNCLDNQGHTISKINKKISNKLINEEINNELEFSLTNKSYDLHILDTNILIEINPTYTHNSTNPTWFHNSKKEPLDKNYHIEKTKLALENGYRCIHIWDWDDIDKIIEILKPKEKIYARKCILKEVSIKDSDEFLNKYHLQNTCKGQDIRLGLYYNDKLVEIMTFGKPRYNKKYEYELLRLCTCSNYIIIGGTEKLFKYFINNYKPKSIISYCDNSKFDGEVYKKLGFILKDFGSPSKHWFNGKRHITDNLLRQRGFDQLFNANYGKGTSNEELMIKEGFVEIYDSGQSIYIKEF